MPMPDTHIWCGPSHFWRSDADEMWIWQAGDPLELRITDSKSGPVRTIRLSSDVAAGHSLQGLVPTNAWQAACSLPSGGKAKGYSLVSCLVVPGFDFAGFELADAGWEPGL